MDTQREELEIDLLDLFFYLKKKFFVIVAAIVLLAVAGAAYTTFFMPAEYTAKTRMYVLNRSSESSISSSDYSISNYMIKDYEVLITGQNVASEVINRLKLDMEVNQLTSKISVSAIENTRVLQIVVVDTMPQRAADIANCVRLVASEQIKQIMAVDAVNLVYEAEVPTEKSGPSLTKNTALAAIIGAILSVGVLVVVYLMDDTIRTDEDVTRYLGMSTLGIIPLSKEMAALGNMGATNDKKKKKKKSVAGSKTAQKK